MEDLKKLGVRSIILTSGTLSPMDAFKEDMKLSFPWQLENPHVIDKTQVRPSALIIFIRTLYYTYVRLVTLGCNSQIFVGAIAAGPNRKQLNSSYSSRDSSEYKDELGASILMICQILGRGGNSHLPPGLDCKGGVLVFFPSYGLMEAAVERWKHIGIYARLEEAGGGVLIEPRAGAAMKNTANDKKAIYREKYQPSKNPQQAGGFMTARVSQQQQESAAADSDEVKLIGGLVAELDAILTSHRRCIMLAVCRGKVSEGIDFSDSKVKRRT